MAISTLRPDGWPQATMVSYANEGILIYFVISRHSQKFANIERDDRVSLAIGRDFHAPSTIKSLSIAARASEVRDPRQRRRAIKLLLDRHPELQRLERPEAGHSAVMRANPEIITIRLFEGLRPRRPAHRGPWRPHRYDSSARRLGLWRAVGTSELTSKLRAAGFAAHNYH